MKLSPLTIAMLGTQAVAAAVASAKPGDLRPVLAKRKITPEEQAVFFARKAELEAELEVLTKAKEEKVFAALNAAEAKRERKRAKRRKEAGHV